MLRTLALLALLCLVAFPLRGALDVGFLQDDFNVTRVLGPGLALDGPNLFRLFHPPADEKDTRLRPVAYLTLLVDLAVFGLDPFGLHLTGVLFHLVATALVFRLAGALHPRPRSFAWLTALFFGLAPVHADAVAWLAARADPVAGTFVLATLFAYVRYRRNGRPLAAVTCMLLYAAALLSKEAAVVTPGLALLMEPVLRRRKHEGGLVPALTGLTLLTAAYFLYRRHLFGVFLGHYGTRDAAAWSVAPGDLEWAGGIFLADVPAGALRWMLLAAPILFALLFLVTVRRPAGAGRAAAGAGLLLLAIGVAALPVAPFLDQANGRHFYLAAAPLAALLAGAASVRPRRRGWAAMLPVPVVVAYAITAALGLRSRVETYEDAGAITSAMTRDLGALRAEHPDVEVFVLCELRRAWRKAPLLHSGVQGLARPPFQAEPVPILPHFRGELRDYRWEAYMVRKPAVFLRLRTWPDAPGLVPVSPILRSAPPRRPDPAYECVSPSPGTEVRPGPDTEFRFRIPAGGEWPRPLRLVFAFPGNRYAALLLGPENVEEDRAPVEGARVLVWRPRLGAAGTGEALPLEAPPAEPIPVVWWIEEADLDRAGVRPVPASVAVPFVIRP